METIISLDLRKTWQKGSFDLIVSVDQVSDVMNSKT